MEERAISGDSDRTKGILYGIGVGSGDPEDITLKAIRVIQNCDVLMVPTEVKEESMAYKIAVSSCPKICDKEVVAVTFPMTRDRVKRETAIEDAYGRIRNTLLKGKSVGFLTIGDVTIYSSFAYLRKFAEDDKIPVEMINGIPSFIAASAALSLDLCEDRNNLHIINGGTDVEEALRLSGTKVFLKSGKNLEKLRGTLIRYPDLSVYSVKNCGFQNQEICVGAEQIPDGYMVVVIVKTKE